MPEQGGQGQERVSDVGGGSEVGDQAFDRRRVLAREGLPQLALMCDVGLQLLQETAKEVGMAEIDLEVLEAERVQPLDRHRDDLDLGLGLLQTDQLNTRLEEFPVP
jgi:hypothetical protein